MDSALSGPHIARIAKVFYALATGLAELKSYYRNLSPNAGKVPADTRYFPSITAYRDEKLGLISFKYVGFLENDPDCTTLHAKTKADKDIVVKFVDRYGERAHHILANEGYAPEVLYYGTPHLHDSDPSYESISMVVMDYIKGETLAKANQETLSKETKARVEQDVMAALRLLHANELVFADLRPPNVVIPEDPKRKIQLIDFNWPGEYGQATYPSLISPAVAWPEGVKPSAVMKKEHDLDMYKKLFH